MTGETDAIVSSHEFKKYLDTLPPSPHYDLGIPKVDRLTGGFEPGELIIVTGYSGHGKTLMTQTFTENLEKEGHHSIWFSYEVTPAQFFGRFKELPNFYVPKKLSSGKLPWIFDRILEAKKKHSVKVAFIDHLHYLVDMMPGNGANQSLVIGDLVRQLKRFCIDNEMVIVLIAHTGQPNDDKPPGLGSIRDSSFVVQESDAVFAINRCKERKLGADIYTPSSDFMILKHRRMGTMGRRVKLDFVNGMLKESLKQYE